VIEYCVLALLRDGERYGFELVRTLSEVPGMVTSEGTLYPLLSRLRYYRLTSSGRAVLEAFSGEWASFRNAVDHFLEQEKTA
jgi:PadR family transcriptional regulator PadR